MNATYQQPTSRRGRIVFFIWRNLPRFMLLALCVLIIVLAFAISGKRSAIQAEQAAAVKQERPPVNTVVLPVQPATISNRLNLPGVVEEWTRLELLAEVSGTVEHVLVEEGQSVEVGTLLLQIETDDYRIALERAEAAYSLARADFDRDQAVHAKGVLPDAELERQKTRVQTAKADLDNARLLLERCRVTAPISGVIRRLDAKVGMFLGIGDPIGVMLQIDRVKAVIGIPESDITEVRTLNEIDLQIKAVNNHVVTGSKLFLSASPDSAARLYRLELALDNPEHAILPGMFVRADIVKQSKTNALAVPIYSIISRNNEQYVYIEKDGTAEKRIVTTGIAEKWLVEIDSGLQPGDRVIVEGHRDVEDGRPVQVVRVLSEAGANLP
jgi:membrane fusion protein, multidrug efflux system